MSYVHKWQEPALHLVLVGHGGMEKREIKERGSRKWLLDMEMMFSVTTDFK